MNQVTEEKKESLTKTLAIVGFVAAVVFAVWLAVQIVSILPGAFSSLASIADVVYNYDHKQELEVSVPKGVVNAGDSFTITWTDMRKDGTYSFSYECTDGVSVEIRSNGEIKTVACDTPIDLGEATSLEVRIASEKSRFVDVPYTLTFTQTGASDATVTKRSTITLVNASIPATGLASDEEKEETDSTPSKPTTTQTTPAKPTYTAGTPITTTKYVYTTPVSDPKGKIDLQVTFLGIGTIKGKTFVPATSIDSDDEDAALQFEVKNIGTKTASEWSYEATLPSDITYKSPDQKALKPNERAVITLGFSGVSEKGSEKVSVEVDAEDDVKTSNNEFTKTVKVTD